MLALGCAEDDPSPKEPPEAAAKTSCDADARGVGEAASPMVGGSASPPASALTAGQLLAVGALVSTNTGSAFCSATLVSQTVVLSAAHCVVAWMGWDGHSPVPPALIESPASLRFGVGEDMAAPTALLEVAEVLVPPDIIHVMADDRVYPSAFGMQPDLALIVLRQPAQAAVPGIEPIPIREVPLEESIGAQVLLGGFGFSDAAQTILGKRFWTTFELLGGNRLTVGLNGVPTTATVMPGDSGSGFLVVGADGSVRTAGALTGPLFPKRAIFGGRVDAHLEWIYQRVDTECSALGEVGGCEDGVARWCESGRVSTEACADGGKVCELDSCGRHRCAEPREADPRCADLDYAGRCSGDLLQWCVEGEYRWRDCAAHGQRCLLSADTDLGNTCLEELPSGDGDVLSTCEAIDACENPCNGDMWCAFDCFARADHDALAGYGVFGHCTVCTRFTQYCQPDDPGFGACTGVCDSSATPTPACSACIDEVCGPSPC